MQALDFQSPFSSNQFESAVLIGFSSETKAEFANNFVQFVLSGFHKKYLTNEFYLQLSNVFPAVARRDKEAFLSLELFEKEYLNTMVGKRCLIESLAKYSLQDLGNRAKWRYLGDLYTSLREWIDENMMLEAFGCVTGNKIKEVVELKERQELKMLFAKFHFIEELLLAPRQERERLEILVEKFGLPQIISQENASKFPIAA